MGWIDKKVQQGPKHVCELPESGGGRYFEPRSVWACDDCGEKWEFIRYWHNPYDGMGGDTWEKTDHPFTRRRQDGMFPGPDVTCVVCGKMKKEHEVDRTSERD